MPAERSPLETCAASSRFIDVDDVSLHLFEAGAGEPLLVLHPAGGAGEWLPYHAELAKRFRVIAPDHPGFGQTPTADRIESVDDIAFLYSRMLDILGLENVSVLGVSLGGWIAAELAVLDPRRVQRLVLVNAVGLRIPGAPIADLFAMTPAQKATGLFHDQQVAGRLFAGELDIETIMRFYRDESAFARYAWVPFCCNPKLSQRLWRIVAPTLVLLGAHDRIVPRAHGELYASSIPNARLEVVPSAGHALLIEEVDAGIAAVNQFMSACQE